MNRIKLFSLTLVLSLVGVVYAAGGNAQTTAQVSVKDQPGVSCCAAGAECCKEGASCCASHKSDHKNHSRQPSERGSGSDTDKSCCASGCAKHKEGQKAEGQSCALNHKEGADCCSGKGEGAGCCTEGACSTTDKQ